MSGISISPYFPFRRLQIAKQAVDAAATKAEIDRIDFHLHSFGNARCVVRICLFMESIFPCPSLRLSPVLNCSTLLTGLLLVRFIGTLGDLRGNIDRFSGHGVKNAPFDHHDLHGVVHDQA
jgi:hypothetical protein